MNPETLLRILKDGTVGSYKVALFLSLSHPDKYSSVGEAKGPLITLQAVNHYLRQSMLQPLIAQA